MKNQAHCISRIIVLAVAALIILPWGGRTRFNTKGEPREAVVAVSMLNTGNYVLPESYGHDIAYKPPMLAWCIAGASLLLNDGHVSEYTSRLPSAIAALALVLMTFNWVARRRDYVTASLTALVTVTAFEVFRNAVICRVDMLLTFFIVGSIFLLDTEGLPRRKQALSIAGAILLMGCAALTKGPVGALLPCLVTGVHRLFMKQNFFAVFFKLTGCALAAIAIASTWYYAAWLQGGDRFIDLVMEENIGRLTGTMSYDSHVNPWWYNIVCVLYGMLPYTLLAIAAIVPLRRRTRHGQPVVNARQTSRTIGPDAMLAICAAVLTIGFYCIPSSKRSTYLLPAYPFMAFGIVLLYNRLAGIRSGLPKAYARFVGTLAAIVTIAMLALRTGAADFIDFGKSGVYIAALAHGNISWWEWIPMCLPLLSVIAVRRLCPDLNPLAKSVIYLVSIYILFLSTIQPLLLNMRSNADDAALISQMAGKKDTPIYSYLGEDPYMRYFTVNYYLGDRLRMIEKTSETPADSSLLLMNPRLENELRKIRPEIRPVHTGHRFVSCDKRRDTVGIYRIYSE